MRRAAPLTPVIDMASAYYHSAGRFAWHWARGKLAGDPFFAAILARGLLGDRTRVLDLGCGQGLLAAWLLAARACHASDAPNAWPQGWPAPPRLHHYTGIEINPREIVRARRAFARDPGADVRILQGDICDLNYDGADAVVILDVLHYLDLPSQEQVLRRVRGALSPHGLLLLRVADQSGGTAFAVGKAVDRAVTLVRCRRWVHFEPRPLRAWEELLAGCGYRTQALLMSAGTPFANVLLCAETA